MCSVLSPIVSSHSLSTSPVQKCCWWRAGSLQPSRVKIWGWGAVSVPRCGRAWPRECEASTEEHKSSFSHWTPKYVCVWGRREEVLSSAGSLSWAAGCIQSWLCFHAAFWQLLKSQALQQEFCVFRWGLSLEEECRIKTPSARERRSWGHSQVGDGLGGGGKLFQKPVKCNLLLEFQ